MLLPPGDDAAVIERPAGPLAATTDLLVEDVDFLRGEDPERLGRRAAAVNLSDLAAIGAQPEFFLLSIGFPPEKGEAFPLAVAKGAISRAGQFGAHLVGGDLSAAPQTIVSVALWGRPVAAPISRAGASPGDWVYVSGSPGQAAAGLRLARILEAFAEHGSAHVPRFAAIAPADQDRLLNAFHDPIPRIALGLALARHRLASAAIDVSDGLGVDAGRLAHSSHVRIVVEKNRLPISPSLVSFAAIQESSALDLVLAGGDDYELLFTVPESEAARLPAHASDFGVAITRIGRVEPGSGAVLRDRSGERDIAELGHDHLEAAP